jgi:hypothetical protein
MNHQLASAAIHALADIALHVNIASGLWTLSAAAGLGFSVAVIPQYVAKIPQAKRLSPRNRKTGLAIIYDFIFSEVNRAVQHTLSLTLGVISFFVPPAPAPSAPIPHSLVIYGLCVVFVFLLLNILATLNSGRAYIAWRRRFGIVVQTKEATRKP